MAHVKQVNLVTAVLLFHLSFKHKSGANKKAYVHQKTVTDLCLH